jgi:hypothetical protein
MTARRLLVLPVWLALALTLCAGPPPELPAEVKGDVGAFVRVPAKTEGKSVRWVALDAGLNVFPAELLKDSRTAVVTAPVAGRYRLLAYTAQGDEPSDPAICVVVIGVPPPPDPPPQPPPDPSDPLARSLKAAWAQETDPQRAGQVAFLASIYKACGAGVLVDDPAVKTNADLLAALRDAVHKPGVGIPQTALMKIRPAIAEYMASELGTSPTAPLDRAKAKAAAAKIGVVLETLK